MTDGLDGDRPSALIDFFQGLTGAARPTVRLVLAVVIANALALAIVMGLVVTLLLGVANSTAHDAAAHDAAAAATRDRRFAWMECRFNRLEGHKVACVR